MASSSFTFLLECPGPSLHVPMLGELATAFLEHLGCSTVAAGELIAALEGAIADGRLAGADRCGVQFEAHDQRLDILVSADGGCVWQTSCAVP